MIQSIWHTKTTTEIRQTSVNLPKENQCKIVSKYSMVSLGTETLVLNQNVPKSVQQYMAVPYMDGTFNLPIKYGYALSGVLENGDKVHAMHPHQTACVVNKKDVFNACQDLPLQRIPLISNIETVINAIWDSNITPHKKVVVCGFGNIGALLATTLKHHFNIEVEIVETNTWRRQKALELGFKIYDTKGFDIAFNTTANEKALQFCIDNANEEAEIIELSWYGTSKVSINFGETFHTNRLRLIASQVSKIPLKKRDTYDYFKRKLLAVSILKNAVFDTLITTIIPFKEAPHFFNDVRHNKTPNGLIYLIKY